MDEEQLLKNRLMELAKKSYTQNMFTFTGFLNEMQIAVLQQMIGKFGNVPFCLYGGAPVCERQMVRFGSIEELGYEMPFPIACIKVQPLLKKFAEELSHRDFLGALMNLGIDRSTIGDILVNNEEGYFFCTDKMADYVIENLDKIKHTHVKCMVVDHLSKVYENKEEKIEEIVSSLRIDVILSKIFHLSRSQSLELFRERKVFVNSKLCENNDYPLKKDDVISMRGYGKIKFEGILCETKKEKFKILICKYL